MGINRIETSNGKIALAYKIPDQQNNNEHLLGNKVDDYEILQVLGRGAFGFVAKVRSKKDSKIYAMKKISLSDKGSKYHKNEIKIMEKLNHPHINKMYTSFTEENDEDSIYYIIEYMENGDLNNFIYAYKNMEKTIKEEIIWNFYLQCLEGLVHIHKMGIIHRDITPRNIFMDDIGNVKIGDFGVSTFIDEDSATKLNNNIKDEDLIIDREYCGHVGFIAPEMNEYNLGQWNYDQKADVYSMGVSIFYTCFYEIPDEKNTKKRLRSGKYSEELYEIIRKMLSLKEKRPTSEEIYKLFIFNYINKYSRTTGLYATLKCLSFYDNFMNYFKNEKKEIYNLQKSITKHFLEAIDLINKEEGSDKLKEFIFDFQNLLCKNGLPAENNNSEIDPEDVVSFLFQKIHQELNVNQRKIVDKTIVDSYEKDLKYKQFLEFYASGFSSIISKKFFGTIVISRKCSVCFKSDYIFTLFSFLKFDINILCKKLPQDWNLKLSDAFQAENLMERELDEESHIYCRLCNKISKHREKKTIYQSPKNLIIFFERGRFCENKKYIEFPELLRLNSEIVEKIKSKKYDYYLLLGFICRFENKNGEYRYILFYKENENKGWYTNDDKDEKDKSYDLTEIKEKIKDKGCVVALFYHRNSSNKYKKGYSSSDIHYSNLNNNINSNNMNDYNSINPQKTMVRKSENNPLDN